MTQQFRSSDLAASAVATLVESVDGETARKLLEIIGRDRVLVGCIGVYGCKDNAPTTL